MVESEAGNDEYKSENYDTLKHFQNLYSLGVYHEFLEYIFHDMEN